MTVVLVPPVSSRPSAAVSFEIGYVAVDGVERRVPFEEAWQIPLEAGRSVRRFLACKGSGI